MATIDQLVTDFLTTKEKELRQIYISRCIEASGKFGDELKVDVTLRPNQVTGRLLGSSYSYFVEYGRKPGKRPPITAIEQWIIDKNLTLNNISVPSLAFLVARKIGNEGTKGTGIISEVFTPQSFADLGKQIGAAYLREIKSDIIKKFI